MYLFTLEAYSVHSLSYLKFIPIVNENATLNIEGINVNCPKR